MKENILIADDSKTNRNSLINMLSQFKNTIFEAENGIEALGHIKQNRIDLIITDLVMPRMDGFTLCRELKNNDETRSIPIIIFSDFSDKKRVEEGFTLGAWAFVPKSQPDELLRIITKWNESHHLVNKWSVLVVDDSPTICYVVKDELTLDGYKVITANDGQEAWNILQKPDLRPDIIVTDIEMPGMNGLDLLQKIKKDSDLSEIPVVVMSSDSDRSTIMRTVQAGAVSYLSKPFGSGQLSLNLELILSNQFRLLDEVRKRIETERQLLIASITSLANALEAKDLYTRGHSEAVAEMAVLVGKEMGFSERQLEQLKLAGLLHDLGKIGIRDDILSKTGPLNRKEYDYIKTHVEQLEVILTPITSAFEILRAARCHHERWDGKGYPRGLKGTQIPIEGRILKVADVYDSVTRARPYRDAISKDKALRIIRDGMGTEFCPTVTPIFLSVISKLRDPGLKRKDEQKVK